GATLDRCSDRSTQLLAVLPMDPQLQLFPGELRIGRPAEFRLEGRIGAGRHCLRIQTAKADPRGREYQLQLIAAPGEPLAVVAERSGGAVWMGTRMLVVN